MLSGHLYICMYVSQVTWRSEPQTLHVLQMAALSLRGALETAIGSSLSAKHFAVNLTLTGKGQRESLIRGKKIARTMAEIYPGFFR
jgi:hypothetical protein